MDRNALIWAMFGFAIAGLSVSAYLTYLSLMPPTSCPVGDFAFFSCDEVIWSVYSKLYGVSVALLGFGWFVVSLALIVLTRWNWHFIRGVLVWALLGTIGVGGFVYTEVFLIGSICPLCTIAHLAGIAIFALSVLGTRSHTAPAES